MRARVAFKKIINTFLYCLYLGATVLFLIEIAYRYQLIDFYNTELVVLNSESDLKPSKEKKTVLICGDSFTAQFGNWAAQLKKELPDYRVVNSAVAGTSIVETYYLAPGRIKSLDPDVFIYQIYVGNDLLGVRHRLNWRDWSAIRNIYWWLSDKIHVLSYFNYKMGQSNFFRSATVVGRPAEDKFDLNHYALREKIYAKGDPFLISNSVLLTSSREEDMNYLLNSLSDVISDLKPDCRVYLLVIPHKSQLNTSYLEQMSSVGFRFEDNFVIGNENYPFIEAMKNHFQSNPQVKIINPFLPLMRRDSTFEHVYYLNDEHLTPVGQAITAEQVLKDMGNFDE